MVLLGREEQAAVSLTRKQKGQLGPVARLGTRPHLLSYCLGAKMTIPRGWQGQALSLVVSLLGCTPHQGHAVKIALLIFWLLLPSKLLGTRRGHLK